LLDEIVAEVKRIKVCKMAKPSEYFNAIIGEIECAKR
jgi:hypothetical protein